MVQELKDMDMAAAAEQLMQLSGDEDNDNIETSSGTRNINSITNINKRKNHKNVVGVQSHDDQSSSNHQLSESLMGQTKKRRRYRSIIHLYMSTKPIRSIS